MTSHVVRLMSPRLALACVAVLALAACERAAQEPPDTAAAELAWARAALERNPQIEVVASDAAGRVFTIRDKASGEVQIAKLDEIAAVPVSRLQSMSARPPAEPTAQSSGEEPAATTAQTPSAATSAPSTSEPASPEQSAAAAPAQSTSSDAGYTIERNQGQLRVTGPGVSIVSSGQPAGETEANAAQRTSEPIICEGHRMVHFDNREIHVEGDAIIVRDGCEMFITNSRIVATGTGVIVRDGVVHVSNSYIEGAQGSFDADAESKMYVRSSTFQGLSRRDELAMVQDQGGNKWR